MTNILSLTPQYTEMLVRFAISLAVNWFIIDRLYYRRSKRRDFYFTFLLTSVAIFFLVYFMIFGLDQLGGKTSMGIGIGLFGIFSIMRYRTDAMPAREMTYLFTVISLSVVNAIANSATVSEVLLTDLLVILMIWLCEKGIKVEHAKLIQYDRIELVKPERRDDLLADLKERLGIEATAVEVGSIDLLRDMAMLKVYYKPADGEASNSVDNKIKLQRADLTTV